MKAFLLFLATFLLCAGVSFSAEREWEQTQIAGFLSRLDEGGDREKARRIEFREQKFSPLFRDPVIATGTLWFAPPDKFRREVPPPDPSTIIGNGQKLWLLYPDFKEIEEYDLDGKFPFAREMEIFLSGLALRDLPRKFRIRAWGDAERISRMELRPRGGSRAGVQRILITMNPDSKPKTLEIFSHDGTRSIWDILGESHFSPPPGFFEPLIPPDWKMQRPLEAR
jgi:hypothetical protein